MAVVCCQLNKFVKDIYSPAPTWNWGRLSVAHTYIIIFAKHQKALYKAFNLVKGQVNVLVEIPNCLNVVHPDLTHGGQGSRNTVVVFEIPVKMGPPKPRKKKVV